MSEGTFTKCGGYIPTKQEMERSKIEQDQWAAQCRVEEADILKRIMHSNVRLMKTIRRTKGDIFHNRLLREIKSIEDFISTYCQYSLVRKPEGSPTMGAHLTKVWIKETYSREWESCEGIMSIQLKENLWLQILYTA